MFSSSYNQRNRSHDLLVRCNFAIVIFLTISSTALTAYILNFIVTNTHRRVTNTNETIHNSLPQSTSKNSDDDIVPQSSEVFSSQQVINNNNINKDIQGTPSSTWTFDDKARVHKIGFDDGINSSDGSSNNKILSNNHMFKQPFKNNSLVFPDEWRPIVDMARKDTEKDVHYPDVLLSEGLKKFKERLSNMSKIELLKLLKIVQDRIDMSVLSLKKRNVDRLVAEPTKVLDFKLKKNKENVVTRSEKMKQLMDNLEIIESVAPELDENKLNKITKSDNDKSIVRIVKPDLIEAVTKKPSLSEASIDTLGAISGSTSWRNEIVASLQPVETGWPQEEVVVEDWPVVQPSVKPKRKKKKKKITTTSTTTLAPVIIETTPTYIPPSPAPPSAFEEVWIEEEEDIVRPPRRKLKKYKKKTSQAPETTTTSTTTTTTTTTTSTTKAPTTVAPEVVTEDWPNDDLWPQSSTKAPVLNTWPEKQEIPEQQGKWPEEEWLNAVRDNVQNQYNILYI